jgi:hypothetical protein
MFEVDRPLFYAQRDFFKETGRCFVISNRHGVYDLSAPFVVGRLLQDLSLPTFALEPMGGHTQTCVFHFFSLGSNFRRMQGLRLLLPNATAPGLFRELDGFMKLAQSDSVDREAFTLVMSRMPVKRHDGKSEIKFPASSFALQSIKNFILEDDNGRALFAIHRSAAQMCGVRIRAPITPIIAFALSVAIVAADR